MIHSIEQSKGQRGKAAAAVGGDGGREIHCAEHQQLQRQTMPGADQEVERIGWVPLGAGPDGWRGGGRFLRSVHT